MIFVSLTNVIKYKLIVFVVVGVSYIEFMVKMLAYI